MIKLTCPGSGDCRIEYLSTDNIARITEAGTSSQWHGIRSIVRTFDGAVLECCETIDEVRRQIEGEKK